MLRATVSDLRSRLKALSAVTDVVAATPLDASQTEQIATIRATASSAMALADEALETTGITTGAVQLERTSFDLRAAVDDVLRPYAPVATARGIALAAEVDAETPAVVVGDRKHYAQVLGNLVDNAVRYASATSVRVTVRPVRGAAVASGTVRVRTEVVDDGVGMPAHVVRDLFRRAPATSLRTGPGGLATCRELVRHLGGELGVTSVEGRGSIFGFDVVVDIPGARPAAPVVAAPVQTAGRVLVVEDNDVNCKVAEAMLGRFGCDVTIARDGRAGVDAALGGAFDLVLMDCRMPGLDGFGATRQLREAGYRGPIVALTAQVLAGDRERCLEAGMDGYLAKPIDMEELRAMIDRYVGAAGR